MKRVHKDIKLAFSCQWADEVAAVHGLLEGTSDIRSERAALISLCLKKVLYDGQPILCPVSKRISTALYNKRDETGRTTRHSATFRMR